MVLKIGALQILDMGFPAEHTVCSQVGQAARSRAQPKPSAWNMLPNKAVGAASHTRPFPGSYLKRVIKAERPPSPGSGSGHFPDAVPTPLAEFQGDFSL